VNGIEPGCAIRIAERNAPMHLFPVLARVKIVRIQKNPLQALRQQFTDGGLSGAGDTHDEDNHEMGIMALKVRDRTTSRFLVSTLARVQV
jgi:hypothetical protein